MVIMMKDEELEKLKTEFIVDENKYNEERVPQQIKRLLKFARVGTGGKVFVEPRNLSPDYRLKVILVARFLANKLHLEINPQITIEELSEYSHLDKDQVRARMSNIVRQKFAKRVDKGIFIVLPFQINKFIEELNSEE